MSTVISDTGVVHIPDSLPDLNAFRTWVRSDEFPEVGRICYLAGEVWIDMSKEQFFSHNQIKSEFGRVLSNLAKETGMGRYVPDGMLLTNTEADLSSQPDGAFVSNDYLRIGRVRLVEGPRDGYLELEGSPNMTLEVVSDSSVEKDTERLPTLYWKAGVDEYWLVDARHEELVFRIQRRGEAGFIDVEAQDGWIDSEVFERSFQLTRNTDVLGHPEFTLSVRPQS